MESALNDNYRATRRTQLTSFDLISVAKNKGGNLWNF